MRRIFAGSIAALLLSVSPLAAACDLACAFATVTSDCHSGARGIQDSSSGAMSMDGMVMAGMTMPKTASRKVQAADSAISPAGAVHPSIGDMGLCEKQACDSTSAVSTKATRSVVSHFNSLSALIEAPRAEVAQLPIHNARDDIAASSVHTGTPLPLNLRI